MVAARETDRPGQRPEGAQVIVDRAIYRDGRRCAVTPGRPSPLPHDDPDSEFVWLGLVEPTAEELDQVAAEFSLHPLAAEDAVHARQRPKLERYDGAFWFMVLKTVEFVGGSGATAVGATPPVVDSGDLVRLGEVMLFVGNHFVVTVRHGATSLAEVRAELEANPEDLACGPWQVVYTIADHIVDEYEEALRRFEEHIEVVQQAVFSQPTSAHAQIIFRVKREVLELRQAVLPLVEPLERLASGPASPVLPDQRAYFRDVADHARRIAERVQTLDALLTSALDVNVAQVGMRQNEDMRKISAWVAILAVPTMIAGIYGMNFDHMPELRWRYGYPAVLVTIVVLCVLLYRNFKRRGWL